MNINIALDDFILESNKEEMKNAIKLLINKLNNINNTPNEKYYLGILINKGRLEQFWEG